MPRFPRVFVLSLLIAAFPAFAVAATDNLSVRANVQDGFVRFVFSGPSVPGVEITKTDSKNLRLTFGRAVQVTGLDTAGKGIDPALSLKADSETVFSLSSTAVDITRFRSLTLGNRLFVDVFTGKAPVVSVAPAPVTEAPKPAVEAPPAMGQVGVEPMPAPVEAVVKESVPPQPFQGSAMVSIGSTQGLPLAVFERGGYLWIIAAQENLKVPPVLSGPSADAIGPIESVPIDGGSAYRVKMPEGAYVRPEGASLVWRFYIEGKNPEFKEVKLDRDFSNTEAGPKVRIPINSAYSVLRFRDPEIGEDLAVVTVIRAEARVPNTENFVDFDILPAIVGAVVRPKSDGMRVALNPQEMLIERQGGLRIAASEIRPTRKTAKDDKPAPEAKRLSTVFRLTEWALGGPADYLDSRRALDMRIASADEAQKIPELMSAAKFMLGQGLAPEGLGYISMAQAYMPVLADSGEFQALRGGLLLLAGQIDDGLTALTSPGLEGIDEVKLWKAHGQAATGNIVEAQKNLPDEAITLLQTYPERVQMALLPPLIDIVLSRGNVGVAETFTNLLDKAAQEAGNIDSSGAISYYRGRIALLRGNMNMAIDNFRDASNGVVGPYPVRATLALVERGLSAKTISREDAITKLERFRYGWRGDALETEVLQRLGLIFVTGGEQRRGLTILRDAAGMAPDEETREKLVAVMQKAFKELFSGKTKEKMSPLEAAAVATEFSELMPSAGDGEQITLAIADKMLAVDLLDRAADLIEPMIDSTETMANGVRYAQRAAAIRIDDNRPEAALKDIDKALSRPDVQGNASLPASDLKAFALLRAKAKDQQKRYEEAFAELNSIPEDAEVLRLKADIAWGSQQWNVAADAFAKLVKLANLDATRPATKDQAQMILNLALALNLTGQTGELEKLRLGYTDIMRRTDLNQSFQLVTRTTREAKLADRSTLLKLASEVNMFKDVLDAYKLPDKKPVEEKLKTAVPAPADSQTDQKENTAPVEPGQEKKTEEKPTEEKPADDKHAEEKPAEKPDESEQTEKKH